MTTVADRVEADQADLDGIERAALDYLEGYVTGDPERHLRAYHPECIKRRLTTDPATGVTEQIVLSPQTMADFAATGQTEIVDCRVEIYIDDVYEDMASVRVYSCNWVDFLHVLKARGEWRLFHVTWHGRPTS